MKASDILKSIKKSIDSESIDKSTFSDITDYLDTGCMSINRVITGDVHKGFPVGRLSTIYGASQSGKSLLVANTIVNALKNDKVDVVYIFDSEGGVLVDYFRSHGVDLSKIEHIPVASIEQCSVKMLTLYDTLVKARQDYLKDPKGNDNIRALVVLDSFGALSADKLVTDAVKKDQMVQDMGLGAKLKNNMMRGLMMRVVQSQATLLVVNHEYKDPASMFTQKIHAMAGGSGLQYASHVILQCEKVFVKSDDTEFLSGVEGEENQDTGFYKGSKLKFFTAKNRVAKPMYTATVYIDFNNGISKYEGLIEDAVKMGYLEEVRGGYVCKSYSDKKVTYRDLVSNSKIWDTFIEDFNAKSIKLMGYSNGITDEIDSIEESIKSEEIPEGLS